MTNLIGDEINDYERWLTVPGATIHLYGKGEPKPGRKMGHVTGSSASGQEVGPLQHEPVKAAGYAGCVPATMPAGSSLSQR